MDIPTTFTDKAKFVLGIFTNVETEYDFLLHLLTLTLDSAWRKRMISKICLSAEVRVLDLACGTGLVTFQVANSTPSPRIVVGLDLSPAMLRIASRNRSRRSSNCPIEFVRAVGEFLPFRPEVFDYITVGLALRNFADKLAVFKESRRILRSSGCFLSIDFVHPEDARIWSVYRLHIFRVLPAMGSAVSSYWKRTLVYLANSIAIAVPAKEICERLREVGFRSTFLETMSFGVVALIGARK